MDISSLLEQLNWIPWLAGPVWLGLTGLLVYTLYQTKATFHPNHPNYRWGLGLLAFIWAFPVYTYLFPAVWVGELGNIATLGYTIFYFSRTKKWSPNLALWILPQLFWISVASIYGGLLVIDHI